MRDTDPGMWNPATRLSVLLILTLLLCRDPLGPPNAAVAFTLDDVLTNGTPDDPSDDLQDAVRWSNVLGSLVDDNVRGLGGGIEYAVDADLCDRLTSRFIDTPRPSCNGILHAIRSAFDQWEAGHPTLRFVDISDRVTPTLPEQDALGSPGPLGAEVDILARSPEEFPRLTGTGSFATFRFQSRPPVGVNGRTMPGKSLVSSDIVLNTRSCYHLDPALAGRNCNHFESLLLHEIGHTLGLDHPNEFPARNFDTDDDPTNPIVIDCDDPARGLRPARDIDPAAVMNSSLGQAEPVHVGLTNDDIGGRDFLYPVCG